ncbi:MAG TPA: DUF4082 domain-containing protein [Mycobacteriales bacterium]|nr:DUF4082 domain-containing protein [Mycobacteriales bacterium]
MLPASWSRPRRGRMLAGGTAALAVGVGVLTPIAVSPAAAATCPCTIWAGSATPATPSDPDTAAVEVGVKFQSDVAGSVTGVRFYKGTGNTGTHVGHLWDRAGQLLATATFTGESASGWQQVLFSAPVPISAGATYVASYYAPNGHYAADAGFFAAAGVDNAPLHALRDGADGGNGVYAYGTGGGFPINTWQSVNYWVDVVFATSATDTVPPTVTATAPATNATGVPGTTTVSATFSEPVQAGTVGFTLKDPGGGTVPATQSYDPATRTTTLAPTAPLAASTSYTATVSGAQDTAGNTMAPYTWSFTTSAPTACPCSIWPGSATPAVANVADASAVELGVKLRSSSAGLIKGIRFYKGSQNTGVHTGTLWSRTGTSLATVTFSGESASGWQQALFASPVSINANTTYVASYHTNVGFYSANGSGLATAVSNGPLTALANGTDGGNGVYAYGGGGFPANTFQATNYWVDVVFDTPGPDTTPPTVLARTPAPGASGVATSSTVSATFSEDVQPASVTLRLTDAGGATVAGTVSYASGSRTATLTPAATLATSATYTATVSGATDLAGNVMAGNVTWSFTTAAPPPPPPTQGPGGPILVIGNAASPTSQLSLYTAEILRAEGLNEFATADLAGVTAATLAPYDVVILGATPLTAGQVSMFTTWVNGGGRLVAFRPDKQLAGLLGLTATAGTTTNGYLKVNTAAAPGAGITDQTIQYHGVADQFTLAGATSVATLYSNATTATAGPAVTLRSVGTSGGRAAAFTYDLPQSIVYTRQGNPAWAGQERDGQAPIRSDDLYFGGSSTDWVNLGKVAIPQADEQQRLLANLVGLLELNRMPLPRFWYLPRSAKAVVVGTGDDHGNGGTAGRFDQYLANSPAGCSVDNWTCLRFTSYMYPSTPLTDARASSYRASGFELGLHPQNGCGNFTATSLENDYASQLVQFGQSWPSLPSPVTSRYHCIVYSDWASQPKTELRHGIRLDANYYYWPSSWITDRPGFMTGSGMPMRFADTNGTIIDAYQAATQMTDESGQSYPATPNTLLDNALGPLGYYGAFTANMHTDNATEFEDDQLIASATARGVPIISAQQMLTWLDGRNGSSFGSIGWSGSTLSFTVAVGTGANGLTGMVPTAAAGGLTLTGLTRGGTAVPFTRTTVKGVEYAFFTATAGSYAATYGAAGGASVGAQGGTAAVPSESTAPASTAPASTAPDRTAPQVSSVSTFALPDGTATVTWRTDEAAGSTALFGTSPTRLDQTRYDTAAVSAHAVVLTHLDPDRTYYYRVESTDRAGNRMTWPATGQPAASFVSAGSGVADRGLAELRMAGQDGTYVQQDGFGEVSLAPEEGQEFGTPSLPGPWEASRTAPGGRQRVLGGQLTLDGDRAQLRRAVGAGRSLSFAATFDARSAQAVGWRSPSGPGPAAVLATSGGEVYAATTVGSSTTWQTLRAGLSGTPHAYRIDWSGGRVRYYVDGVLAAEQAISGGGSMRPVAEDSRADGVPLAVDWVRMSRYAARGTLVSRVLDAQAMVTWDRASWQADVSAGTALAVRVRTGSTPRPDGTWSGWRTLSGPGARVVGSSRYLQYELTLTTRVAGSTPVLRAIGFTHSGPPPIRRGEVR